MRLPARLLSVYLASRVLMGVALVSVLLLGLYTLVELIREVRALGGSYGPAQMLLYLLQTTPRRLYDIFPFSALIGSLLGLSSLAAGNELVAMRAAGFDRLRIMVCALTAIGLCLLLLLFLAEWSIPELEVQAREGREHARTGQAQARGFGVTWLRDGDFIVRVGQAAWEGDDTLVFADVMFYSLSEGLQLQAVYQASRAQHDGNHWKLFAPRQLFLDADHVSGAMGLESLESLRLSSNLSPDLFAATVARPRLLSLSDLSAMMLFMESNGLDASRYRQAFWSRVYFPINVLAMVLLGLPFVFRDARHGQRGMSLFAGVSLGMAYFVLTRLSQGFAVLLSLPLAVTLLLPAVFIMVLAGVILRRQ